MLLPDISTHVGSPATWLPGNPVAQFQKSVRRLAALPADTLVLPSHGVPFLGLRERVAELEAHHEQRWRPMAAALGEPRSAAELLEIVFQRELDALQLMFAMNEAVAHLEYMTDRGQLEGSRATTVSCGTCEGTPTDAGDIRCFSSRLPSGGWSWPTGSSARPPGKGWPTTRAPRHPISSGSTGSSPWARWG